MSSPESRPAVVRARMRGLALLEVLAAMAIGLMVVAAALGALLLSRAANAHVRELALLQQQGSFAMHLIGLQIRQAGAVDAQRQHASGRYAFDAPDDARVSAPAVAIFGTTGRAGAGDTLSLSYAPTRWPDPAAWAARQYDCIGTRVEKERHVQARFAFDSRQRSLVCRGLRNTQPLIGQVADFRVRFRVAAVGVTRELDADEVEAEALWAAVSAVEVCLDLQGDEPAPTAAAARYRDCGDRERPREGRVHVVLRHLFHLRAS